MKRLELFANRSIEEDMFEAFEDAGVAKHYTKIPTALGDGNSGPKMGDHVWPEENFILIVYCEDEEAQKIKEVIGELKSFFKSEGIKLFEMET
jgi:hypothetical protein